MELLNYIHWDYILICFFCAEIIKFLAAHSDPVQKLEAKGKTWFKRLSISLSAGAVAWFFIIIKLPGHIDQAAAVNYHIQLFINWCVWVWLYDLIIKHIVKTVKKFFKP